VSIFRKEVLTDIAASNQAAAVRGPRPGPLPTLPVPGKMPIAATQP